MDERDAFRLTFCEEANDIQIDQAYFVQVERDARPPGRYLSFQFFYMLSLHAANDQSSLNFPCRSLGRDHRCRGRHPARFC
jgi:hypothetical protein